MTAKDSETIGFYAREAEAYASRGREPAVLQLDQFLSRLPAGASILELGCGGGQDS
ncbi:MAG: SAM-dependent methyltransferase, partial [Brucellaceae bacterium]|nr:SAM-dependent methyltransferase [Brucellaceae bacterium]